MYKTFDSPKNKYDIVNKDYVDKVFNNAILISDEVINTITALQSKIIELEDRIAILEGASIKIESIEISGPTTITMKEKIIKVESIKINGPNKIYL